MSASYPSMHVKTKLLASLEVVQHGSVPLIRLLPISYTASDMGKILSIISGHLSSTNVGTSGVLLPESFAAKVS